MSQIKIGGIDISLNNIGVCKVVLGDDMSIKIRDLILIQPSKADAQTKKQVRKNSDDLRRCRWLFQNLQEAIVGLDIICVEIPVGSQSARAMVSYGASIGVLSGISIPMIEVTPAEVKLAGAGHKTASKAEMIEWAINKHPEAQWLKHKRNGQLVVTDKNEHIADALGAIYAGIQTEQFKIVMTMFKRMNLRAV